MRAPVRPRLPERRCLRALASLDFLGAEELKTAVREAGPNASRANDQTLRQDQQIHLFRQSKDRGRVYPGAAFANVRYRAVRSAGADRDLRRQLHMLTGRGPSVELVLLRWRRLTQPQRARNPPCHDGQGARWCRLTSGLVRDAVGDVFAL